ncbi:MAG: lysophospholipid acyltransferase family protein [Desulfovibrionaceae bacterium]|nr:lysophospholipid acyltransferase family protein [Desulfovibrionaceae bacterium]
MKLRYRLLSVLLPPLYRLWTSSLRCEEIGREALDALDARGECAIVCVWHGEIFTVWRFKRQLRLAAMISRSADGEFLSLMAEKFGFGLVRGSSSRGGVAALRSAAQGIREKRQSPCIALDGPRGPYHQVKDGAVFLAHYCEAWMTPVRIFASRCLRFGSWDRFCLPLPFSRVRLVYAEPYRLGEGELTEEALARERTRLKEKMEALEICAFPEH